MDNKQASRIVGGNGATGRRKSDLYPTPPEVTVALVNFLNLPPDTVVWEPADGEGDMVQALNSCGITAYGSDIARGVDFLKFSCCPGCRSRDIDWIITNPPFSLAEEFIRHAAELQKPFAMLLKSTYWHASGRRKLFDDLPPTYILPLTWRPDFNAKYRAEGETGSPLMDVMWCVWLAPWMKNVQTAYQPIARPTEEAQKDV